MSFIFQAGDIVRFKGKKDTYVLETGSNSPYPLKVNLGNDFAILTFTVEGKYQSDGAVILELVERPKKKVPKEFTAYVNVYRKANPKPEDSEFFYGAICNTRAIAEGNGRADSLGVVELKGTLYMEVEE